MRVYARLSAARAIKVVEEFSIPLAASTGIATLAQLSNPRRS